MKIRVIATLPPRWTLFFCQVAWTALICTPPLPLNHVCVCVYAKPRTLFRWPFITVANTTIFNWHRIRNSTRTYCVLQSTKEDFRSLWHKAKHNGWFHVTSSTLFRILLSLNQKHYWSPLDTFRYFSLNRKAARSTVDYLFIIMFLVVGALYLFFFSIFFSTSISSSHVSASWEFSCALIEMHRYKSFCRFPKKSRL